MTLKPTATFKDGTPIAMLQVRVPVDLDALAWAAADLLSDDLYRIWQNKDGDVTYWPEVVERRAKVVIKKTGIEAKVRELLTTYGAAFTGVGGHDYVNLRPIPVDGAEIPIDEVRNMVERLYPEFRLSDKPRCDD